MMRIGFLLLVIMSVYEESEKRVTRNGCWAMVALELLQHNVADKNVKENQIQMELYPAPTCRM